MTHAAAHEGAVYEQREGVARDGDRLGSHSYFHEKKRPVSHPTAAGRGRPCVPLASVRLQGQYKHHDQLHRAPARQSRSSPAQAPRRRGAFRCDLAPALQHRRQHLPDRTARRRHPQKRRGHRRHRADRGGDAQVPIIGARRRHQPVRPVDRPRHRRSIAASISTRSSTSIRPRASCRVQPGVVLDQLNRAAGRARSAVRARRRHRQPGQPRRHDRQQLRRRALHRLRQNHRSRPPSRRRPVPTAAGPSSAPSRPPNGNAAPACVRLEGEYLPAMCEPIVGTNATRSNAASRASCGVSAATTSMFCPPA